ncbi:MAG: methyltransferase domain-containing protein [Planctomycetota bacterium]
MGLADDYRRQFAWRDWPRALALLPDVSGHTVLDLGCGVGDLAAELVRRGARVRGFDGNDELLAAARGRHLDHAEFHRADLRALPADLIAAAAADGIWCSFAAAYFCDLAPVLRHWLSALRPGGWIALTEVDDMFAHEPVSERTRTMLARYVEDGLAARRYDFRMGRRLAGCLREAGCDVRTEITLDDRELAGDGPLSAEVVAAWDQRLQRMQLLQAFCGDDFGRVRRELLAALAAPNHVSRASVRFVLAHK